MHLSVAQHLEGGHPADFSGDPKGLFRWFPVCSVPMTEGNHPICRKCLCAKRQALPRSALCPLPTRLPARTAMTLLRQRLRLLLLLFLLPSWFRP
jgi:hypothetical protein